MLIKNKEKLFFIHYNTSRPVEYIEILYKKIYKSYRFYKLVS